MICTISGNGQLAESSIISCSMVDIDKLISANLRRLIAARNLKQNELARLVNVSPTVINDVLADRRQAGKSMLQRLCEVLGVDVWEFYVTEATPIVTDPGELQALQRHRAAQALGVAEEVSNYESFRIQEAEKAAGGKKKAFKYPVPIDLTTEGRELLRLFEWAEQHGLTHLLVEEAQHFQKKVSKGAGKKQKKRPKTGNGQ